MGGGSERSLFPLRLYIRIRHDLDLASTNTRVVMSRRTECKRQVARVRQPGDRPRPRHPLNQRMTREQGREEGTNRETGVITSDRVQTISYSDRPVALLLLPCRAAVARSSVPFRLPSRATPNPAMATSELPAVASHARSCSRLYRIVSSPECEYSLAVSISSCIWLERDEARAVVVAGDTILSSRIDRDAAGMGRTRK